MGDTKNKKKLHFLNWNTLSRDKAIGGLGLRKAKSKNYALLNSLAWCLFNKPNALWSTVLINKYVASKYSHHSFVWTRF